jgi:glycosyltransferase involved in cell wall biosynthesis
MVDLARGPNAGGHVKCWERLATAALAFGDRLDLTVFFSGDAPGRTELGANVRLEALPPVFSTRRLAWLTGDLPDHTDLAPWHPQLAARLAAGFDVLHTTDAYFAFARTAARVAERTGLPLVNSIHTATPELTRLFASRTLHRLAGDGALGRLLEDRLRLPQRAEAAKVGALLRHQSRCAHALVSRPVDRERALSVLPAERVHAMRRGIDRNMFSPARRDRQWLAAEFGVPSDAVVVLYVGRMDPSKNILLLAEGVRRAVASGAPLVLLCAGEGRGRGVVRDMLGERAFCPGRIEGECLARVYAAADLFALPSEIEIYGNVVLEAMASGLPAVVTERGGMGFLIEPGFTGMVIRGEGAEPWAEVLAGLGAAPDRLGAMRRAVCAAAPALLPTWEDVLAEDLLPVWLQAMWQRAAGTET